MFDVEFNLRYDIPEIVVPILCSPDYPFRDMATLMMIVTVI